MDILIGHECSGRVRDCFIAKGHNAISCDFKPTKRPGPHMQCDVLEAAHSKAWDMAIFFPDCTFLTSSGLHWNGRIEGREEKTEQALQHVQDLLNLDIEKIALENPRGCIGTRIKPSSQDFQPHQFGADASKETHLWLKNLPKLKPTAHFPPRIVQDGEYKGERRWSNQTDSGQNVLTPSEDRAEIRSETYWGVAMAMADQWG